MKSVVQRYYARKGGEGEGDEGFTLIELLVVLLIIGILLAIAIPTFLSVTKGANNTAAQSNLQTALTAADTYYTQNNQTYTGITLGPVDAGISAVTGSVSSNASHTVSIDQAAGTAVALVTWSPGTNLCWGILDLKGTGATAYLGKSGSGTWYFVDKPGSGACKAVSYLGTAPSDSSWAISSSSFPPG